MAELRSLAPGDGLLPIAHGGLTLTQPELGVLTALAPWRGKVDALSAAVKSAHGLALPAPGRATGGARARCLWFGRDLYLLAGPAPDAGLARHAALTDQSDAWAAMVLDGAGTRDVLARLCPLDLRSRVFRRGHSARSLIGHVNVSLTRIDEDAFLILGFRSMAHTLVHELETAMRSVTARESG